MLDPASVVIYSTDPLLYGRLIVMEHRPDGRLLCEALHADSDGVYARELFEDSELERAGEWEPNVDVPTEDSTP